MIGRQHEQAPPRLHKRALVEKAEAKVEKMRNEGYDKPKKLRNGGMI